MTRSVERDAFVQIAKAAEIPSIYNLAVVLH